MQKIVTLDQQLKRVKINSFELENNTVFEFFNKQPEDQRDELFSRALYIGVLALMEDRISAFLAKTQNELGTELESLKLIFDMKKEIFYKTTMKGMIAESDVADYLNAYFKEKGLNDKAEPTGTQAGKLEGNKTGDIICYVDGQENKKVILEIRFDKSMKLGDICDKDIFTKKTDTAWSQLLEAQVNREGKTGIIVFDRSLIDNSILTLTDSVAYINGIGFIAIVDSQKGDYSNLIIAYNLARNIAMSTKKLQFDDRILTIILKRIIKDIETFFSIKKLAETNIKNNNEILNQLEKSFLLMKFNQTYLTKFLKDGNFTQEDLLAFYSGDEVREKYNAIESEINSLIGRV